MSLFFHYDVMFMQRLEKLLQFCPGLENKMSYRVEVCIKVTVRVDFVSTFETL